MTIAFCADAAPPVSAANINTTDNILIVLLAFLETNKKQSRVPRLRSSPQFFRSTKIEGSEPVNTSAARSSTPPSGA
jgi:hypothetical protein